ncbi:hypothetical protein DFH09DRAFT_1085068 [Mycena vulgaris]|nr:hypothetical protein DFH09DRAFT_1085068 [Mycena vulgaris]
MFTCLVLTLPRGVFSRFDLASLSAISGKLTRPNKPQVICQKADASNTSAKKADRSFAQHVWRSRTSSATQNESPQDFLLSFTLLPPTCSMEGNFQKTDSASPVGDTVPNNLSTNEEKIEYQCAKLNGLAGRSSFRRGRVFEHGVGSIEVVSLCNHYVNRRARGRALCHRRRQDHTFLPAADSEVRRFGTMGGLLLAATYTWRPAHGIEVHNPDLNRVPGLSLPSKTSGLERAPRAASRRGRDR